MYCSSYGCFFLCKNMCSCKNVVSPKSSGRKTNSRVIRKNPSRQQKHTFGRCRSPHQLVRKQRTSLSAGHIPVMSSRIQPTGTTESAFSPPRLWFLLVCRWLDRLRSLKVEQCPLKLVSVLPPALRTLLSLILWSFPKEEMSQRNDICVIKCNISVNLICLIEQIYLNILYPHTAHTYGIPWISQKDTHKS